MEEVCRSTLKLGFVAFTRGPPHPGDMIGCPRNEATLITKHSSSPSTLSLLSRYSVCGYLYVSTAPNSIEQYGENDWHVRLYGDTTTKRISTRFRVPGDGWVEKKSPSVLSTGRLSANTTRHDDSSLHSGTAVVVCFAAGAYSTAFHLVGKAVGDEDFKATRHTGLGLEGESSSSSSSCTGCPEGDRQPSRDSYDDASRHTRPRLQHRDVCCSNTAIPSALRLNTAEAADDKEMFKLAKSDVRASRRTHVNRVRCSLKLYMRGLGACLSVALKLGWLMLCLTRITLSCRSRSIGVHGDAQGIVCHGRREGSSLMDAALPTVAHCTRRSLLRRTSSRMATTLSIPISIPEGQYTGNAAAYIAEVTWPRRSGGHPPLFAIGTLGVALNRGNQPLHPTATKGNARMKRRGKREIPKKTRQPAASSGSIPTCESPVSRPGIEPGSPWWEVVRQSAQPPRPPWSRTGIYLIGCVVIGSLTAYVGTYGSIELKWRAKPSPSRMGLYKRKKEGEAGMNASANSRQLAASCRFVPALGQTFPPARSHHSPSDNSQQPLSCVSLEQRSRILLERASQNQFSDTHKTPYDRVKRCRESKINIQPPKRVNVDVFTQNKRSCPQHSEAQFLYIARGNLHAMPLVGGFSGVYSVSPRSCIPALIKSSMSRDRLLAVVVLDESALLRNGMKTLIVEEFAAQ
ncbi:hypothetical protein PR048_004888 [Dryococelus australis]|uniref:Uncharacterized protein n=1 Tax=Dryococelus australis TaxID=614101 RepID=A0ABQ9I6N2_9NEOP|nr:hypothetical protein PR048_004888 [Dryococelus australis]